MTVTVLLYSKCHATQQKIAKVCIFAISRSSRPVVFCKKGVLRISQNSQENTYVAVSFLIKSPETPRTPFYIEHLWWLLLYLLSCMVTFERNKLRANWGWDYIHQRHIEDPVRHLIWAFGKNSKRLRDFYYFYKKFHLRCLTEPPVSYAYSLMISIYLTWHKTKI